MNIKYYFRILVFLVLALNACTSFAQAPIERFEYITSDIGLSQNTVLGIVKDKYGFMWFGTWNGLCRYDGYSFKTYMYDPNDKKSINNNRIHTVKLDKNKNLWVRTFEGDELCRYSYENDNFDRLGRGTIHDSLFLWSERRRNVQFNKVKYKDYVWHIDVQKNRLVQTNVKSGKTTVFDNSGNSAGLNDPYVTDLYKDDQDILWVGTFSNGINKANLNAKPFKHFLHSPLNPQSLIDNNVTAICEDKQGNVWIGTRDKGITVSGKRALNLQREINSFMKSHLVRALFCDSKGTIWIGAKDGLSSYNPLTHAFNDFSKDIKWASVFGITEDDEHNLLFATWKGVVKYCRNNSKFINYDPATMLLHSYTRTIMHDKKGRIWVGCEGDGGTSGGISVLQRDKKNGSYKVIHHFRHLETQNSISDNRINCIYEDANGIIWIGTGNGLDRYDPVRHVFNNLSVNGQFPRSSVVSILEDNKGYLWIGHKKGLSQINKKSLKVRTFTVQDGLQSKEFSGGAAFRSKAHNNMYFGGNNGFNVFNPDSILPEKTLPATVLTELEILNRRVGINENVNGRVVLTKPLYLTKDIRLKNEDKSISIEFAALHYSNPQANKYAYKLEGFDKDWVFTDANRRVATYSNLASGKYIFKVKSSNSDGVWNENPASLHIEVLPPFWASAWAYLFYAVLFLLTLFTYHRYSTRITRLKSKLAYEALIHEQEFELHQNKLQFFTNISHEIKTPLSLILAPTERLLGMFTENQVIYSQLLTMKTSGDRLLKLVNQLLDFRKLETGNLNLDLQKHDIIAFLLHTLQSFKDGAATKNIQLSFAHDVDSCSFPFDEDKIEKVLYNLLSNALKFTPHSGWIKIHVSFSSRNGSQYAIIEVINLGSKIIPEEDLGIIFLPFRQGKGNNTGGTGIGLAYSKGLVELHNGFLTVSSRYVNDKESETAFKIGLPLLAEETLLQKNAIPAKNELVEANEVFSSQPVDLTIPNIELSESHPKFQVMLLVEDNVEMRTYLKDYFSGFYRVLEAGNGRQGFDIAISKLPDIIISDVMMEEMDGLEFCSLIKTDVRTSHIPVILLTAQTPVEAEIKGIETGADDYITKPFNLSSLSSRIKNLLVIRTKLKEKYRREISIVPNEDMPLSADEKMLQRLLNFVEGHIENPGLGVDEICNEIGVSKSQLYKKIREITGLSLLDIIKEIRLKKAKQLLSSHKFTINEIATMVGFSDTDYFRKCFKAEFKMTPTDYIKNLPDNDNKE